MMRIFVQKGKKKEKKNEKERESESEKKNLMYICNYCSYSPCCRHDTYRDTHRNRLLVH